MFEFNLGTFVTDKSTGFCGVIIGRVRWNSGAIQYSVQPPVKEGETSMPDSIWIDGDYFEVDEERGVASAWGAPDFLFDLGTKVKSIHTPLVGYVTGQCQCLNGCLRYTVTSNTLHEGNKVVSWFDETSIESLNKSISQEERTSGGPSSSSRGAMQQC